MTTDKSVRDESWWKLRNLQIDTIVKLVSPVSIVLAVILGGISVYTSLQQRESAKREEDEYESQKAILDMKVDATVTPIDDSKSAVVVDVSLTNNGKKTIRAYAHADDKNGDETYDGEGCTISITRHPVQSIGQLVDTALRVVQRYNMLERHDYERPGSWHTRWALKPETHYRETDAFVLENGWFYEVVARFYAYQEGSIWTNTDIKFVYVPSPGNKADLSGEQ